jgi:putative hydrolase
MRSMSDRDPDDMPFFGLPIFGDMAKAFSAQGPLHWDAARQFAALTATEGQSEANVDPLARLEFADLARIAELHVQQATGLDVNRGGQPVQILTVTPGGWAQRTLEAYRPLFTELATSLSAAPASGDDDDPAMAMFAGLTRMMAPAMMGMAVGSMVGHLARRAFGQYDIPLPREQQDSTLLIVPGTVDGFAQDWSIARDEMRLWVLTQELTGHALLGVPHLRDTLSALVRRHVAGFRPDPSGIAERLGALDLGDSDAMAALERTLSDPTMLLGAFETPEQQAMRPRLDALLAVVVGYVDHVVDTVTDRLLTEGRRIGEAVRRRRVDSAPHDLFVERLLGLHLDRALVERGRLFVAGVIERAGDAGLVPLISDPEALPTPAEVDAPGLWLARIGHEY